jgi:DNA polymerase kappa
MCYRYRDISHQVQEVFAQYDPSFSPMSLDEAYLNFTQHLIQRQSMSDKQRSVVKRCQTPADPTLCRCDLNLTFRSLGSVSSVDHCEENSKSDTDVAGENESALVVVKKEIVTPFSDATNQPATTNSAAPEVMLAAPGSQCKVCGKPVPEYEVVVFGQGAEEAVREMRCRIEQRTCLTASAGVLIEF